MISPNHPATPLAGPPASPNYATSSAALVFTQPARVPLSQPSSQPHVLHSNSYHSDQRNVVPSSSTQHVSVFPHTASRSPPYRQTISSQHQLKDTNTLPNPPNSSHPTGLQQPYYVGRNIYPETQRDNAREKLVSYFTLEYRSMLNQSPRLHSPSLSISPLLPLY